MQASGGNYKLCVTTVKEEEEELSRLRSLELVLGRTKGRRGE